MQSEAARLNAADCPAWCRARHRSGVAFHAHCVGEVRLKRGSVLVTLAQQDKRDCVELSFTVARAETAVAFLDYADLRRLRDHVDEALGAMNPA